MSEVLNLSRNYPSRNGVPVIRRLDPLIFSRRYYTHCLDCSYCGDSCCSYGVDVDLENVARLKEHSADLEAFLGVKSDEWFEDEVEVDLDYPGGGNARARVVDGRCVFLAREGRGCLLHRFALERGLDYHELKPLMSSLFPLSFESEEGDDGCTLTVSYEIEDEDLVCLDEGPTLYRGVRDELRYYFGDEFVAELDALEATFPVPVLVVQKVRLPLVRA